ncbi:hypothetical protein L226DRAFT_527660 [Lentinus tigrinus ALCF2SS1-7]|uniref:uncharacterized protein n=1 Tax=Lentinus tigrinus ALCF2SS1-7 TaxID=1328758 RepID=UPI001165EAF9|nr:hypothetical protein L226DRAFT_527660 [Lentinus tigrinus ALCF2SS1-7]
MTTSDRRSPLAILGSLHVHSSIQKDWRNMNGPWTYGGGDISSSGAGGGRNSCGKALASAAVGPVNSRMNGSEYSYYDEPARGVTYIYSSEDEPSPTKETTLHRIETNSDQEPVTHGGYDLATSSLRKRPREEFEEGDETYGARKSPRVEQLGITQVNRSRTPASTGWSKFRPVREPNAVRHDDEEDRENTYTTVDHEHSSSIRGNNARFPRRNIGSNVMLPHGKTLEGKGKEPETKNKASASTNLTSASPRMPSWLEDAAEDIKQSFATARLKVFYDKEKSRWLSAGLGKACITSGCISWEAVTVYPRRRPRPTLPTPNVAYPLKRSLPHVLTPTETLPTYLTLQ